LSRYHRRIARYADRDPRRGFVEGISAIEGRLRAALVVLAACRARFGGALMFPTIKTLPWGIG
jgi:hypothetical protein